MKAFDDINYIILWIIKKLTFKLLLNYHRDSFGLGIKAPHLRGYDTEAWRKSAAR
jgi:hypothetical protein